MEDQSKEQTNRNMLSEVRMLDHDMPQNRHIQENETDSKQIDNESQPSAQINTQSPVQIEDKYRSEAEKEDDSSIGLIQRLGASENDDEDENGVLSPERMQALQRAQLRQQKILHQANLLQKNQQDQDQASNALKQDLLIEEIQSSRVDNRKKSLFMSQSATKNAMMPAARDSVKNPEVDDDFIYLEQLDESIIDLEKARKEYHIDFEKANQWIKKRSPTYDDDRRYTLCESCCGINTGYHTVGGTSKRSDLDKFGVGMVLYFKFLKMLIFYFFIFTLLSIPSIYFSAVAFNNYNTDISVTMNNLFMASTIGAIGMGSTSCSLGKAPLYTGSTATENKITLSCISGTLSTYDAVTYGLIKASGQSCNLIYTSDVKSSCNSAGTTFSSSWTENCFGKTTCSITVQNSFFDTSSSSCSSDVSSKLVYVKAYCENSKLELSRGTYIKKSTVAAIIASLDAAIIVIYLFMVVTLKSSIFKATRNVLKYSYSAKLYTVIITNLPEHLTPDEMLPKLWKHVDLKMNDGTQKKVHRIVDMQLATSNRLLDLQIEIGETIRVKNEQIREFVTNYCNKKDQPLITYSGVCELKHQSQFDSKSQKNAELAFTKIEKRHHHKRALEDSTNALLRSKRNRVYAAFVTFESISSRHAAIDKISHTYFERLFDLVFGCCINRKGKNYFEGKLLKVEEAEDPGNVLWSNLEVPTFEVILRRGVSIFITLVLFLGSSLILIASTNAKTDFYQNNPIIDCTSKNPTIAEVSADYNLGSLATGLLQCYCERDITGRLNTVFPDSGNKKLCLTWLEDRALTYTLTYAVVFGVIVINYLVQFLFSTLSRFEKHKSMTDQIGSRVLKVFVAQFLNTGVLILVLNAKFIKNANWFFRGTYNDIDTIWYSNIGSTLLATMFINAFAIPALKFMGIFILKLKQCWDRRCRCDRRRTHKKTQKKYQILYLGPQFLLDYRYSQILTLIFICLLYSSGMPILILTAFVQLFLSYYVDKFLLLRVCRTPENYDEDIDLTVQSVLYYISPIHVIFAIWMYGNSDIFQREVASGLFTNSNLATSSSDDDYWLKLFFSRAGYSYNVSLTIIGLIIVLVIISIVFLYKLAKIIYNLCFQDRSDFQVEDESKLQLEQTKQLEMANTSNVPKSNDTTAVQISVSPDGSTTLLNRSSRKSRSMIVQDQVTYYDLLTIHELKELSLLNSLGLSATFNNDVIALIKQKNSRIENEIRKRKSTGSAKKQKLKFTGLYSYDVRLNPLYRDLFALDEILKDQSMNDAA